MCVRGTYYKSGAENTVPPVYKWGGLNRPAKWRRLQHSGYSLPGELCSISVGAMEGLDLDPEIMAANISDQSDQTHLGPARTDARGHLIPALRHAQVDP